MCGVDSGDCGTAGADQRGYARLSGHRSAGRVLSSVRLAGSADERPEHVVFQCSNGVVLGLFSDTLLERRYGRTAHAFRGFTLTIHCETEEVVDRAYDEVDRFDDVFDLDAEPTRSGWGYGFGFRDPEGNALGRCIQVRF